LLLLASRPATATGDGVVAAEHPLAAEIGARVLSEGGSAVDAAIATSLAVCVVNPSSCGIGGGGFMLIFAPRPNQAYALDYRETAPRRLDEAMFTENGAYVAEKSRHGSLAVAVPGEIAGLAAAHRRFGRLAWSRLVEPAVRLARDGFPIGDHLAKQIQASSQPLAGDPELAAVFLDETGAPRKAGSLLRSPALATTLEQVAARGPDAFYAGRVARAIATTIAQRGGVLDAADLAAYRPRWRKPISTTYRGARIYTMPPPSGGGPALALALGVLDAYDVGALGADSPTRWHLFAEILKHSFADRAKLDGDPDFNPPLAAPQPGAVRARIRASQTLAPEAYGSAKQLRDDSGTSHISVIAPDGSAVACTTTINTGFGALMAAQGTGIVLNNEIDDFAFSAPNLFGLTPGRRNHVAPGKRPASSMTPTIVVENDRAVAALGGSGGPLIVSATLEVLSNLLDFHMQAQPAVAAPRVHDQWQPNVLLVEPGVREIDRLALARIGHDVRVGGPIAAVSLATGLPNEAMAGGSDQRKGGGAATVRSFQAPGAADESSGPKPDSSSTPE
jgi:gamma-glutamyltranspeptidase/glutathione hydrolase